jgi:beta-glucanase (GH16 family)
MHALLSKRLLLGLLGLGISAFAHAQTVKLTPTSAYASSNLQPASRAIDNDASTRWESNHGAAPGHLTLDLGSSKALAQIRIDWEAANASSYTVLGSNDNSSWSQLATRSGGSFGDRADTLALSGSYRYVRINALARSAGNNWGYSIWEASVFGPSQTGSCDCRQGCATALNASTLRATVSQGDIVDIHYRVNNGAQQNMRMNRSGGQWSFDITGLSASTPVSISHTIITNGVGQTTPWKNYSLASLASSCSAPPFTLFREAESFSSMAGVIVEPTSDTGGGSNVGSINTGDWMAYAGVVIPAAGRYKVEYRVASPSGGRLSLDLNAGSIRLGEVSIPATGGWQSWRTVSHTVDLSAGTFSLGVYAAQGGWNFNWLRLTRESSTPERELVWADEFDRIDASSWTFETGGGGWGNNELQYYTNGNNASVQFDSNAGSNVLVLEARRENPGGFGCWYGPCTYTSTRMVTRDKRSFQYGRIEARMRLPSTQGIWPAFWMLGSNLGQVGWPQSGEIDIMEHVGFEPNLTHGALHGPGYSGGSPILGTYNAGELVSTRYRVFAVEWDANGIRWFVDGQQFHSATRAQVEARGTWVYDQPFFLLLNVAVGGNWPGSPNGGSVFPQRMYVDYVRVYR